MATGHGQFFVRERPRATFHRRSITNAPAPLCAAPASPKLGDELQRRRHGQRVEKASTASPAGRGKMGVSAVGSGSKRRGVRGGLQRLGTRLASAKTFHVDDHVVSARRKMISGSFGAAGAPSRSPPCARGAGEERVAWDCGSPGGTKPPPRCPPNPQRSQHP